MPKGLLDLYTAQDYTPVPGKEVSFVKVYWMDQKFRIGCNDIISKHN